MPKPTTSLRTALALGTLMLGAPAAGAQGELNEELKPCLPYQAPDNVMDWTQLPPSYGESDAFGRVIIGDWNSDLVPDAAVLAGSTAVAIYKPASHGAPTVLGTAGSPLSYPADIATLYGEGPGRGDAILATSGAGLEIYVLDGDQYVGSLLDSLAWTDAAPLETSDLDFDGDWDIVGVKGTSVLLVQNLASGFGQTMSFTLGYAGVTQIHDVVALDYDVDGIRELALLSDVGLHVREIDGTTVYDETDTNWSYAGAIERVVPDPLTGKEWIAWARDRTGPGNKPEILLRNGTETPVTIGPLSFANCVQGTVNIKPTTLLVGDYTANGFDDLVLVHGQSADFVVLKNTTAWPPYEPADVDEFERVALDPTWGASIDMGIPAFGQIDNDSPHDLIFPRRDNDRLEEYDALPYFFGNIAAVSQKITSKEVVRGESEYTPGAAPEFRFAFEVPGHLRKANSHVLVTVYEEDGSVGGPGGTPISELVYPLAMVPGTQKARRYQWVRVTGMQPGTHYLPTSKFYYWADLKFVDWDPTSPVGYKNPSQEFNCGYTLVESEEPAPWNPTCSGGCFYEHIWTSGNHGVAHALYPSGGVTLTESGGEDLVGGLVPTVGGANFQPGTTPDPPAPTLSNEDPNWYLPGGG